MSIRKKSEIVVYCDGDDCNKKIKFTDDQSSLDLEMMNNRWLTEPNPPNCKGMDKHFCPVCYSKKLFNNIKEASNIKRPKISLYDKALECFPDLNQLCEEEPFIYHMMENLRYTDDPMCLVSVILEMNDVIKKYDQRLEDLVKNSKYPIYFVK